ncbi:hypothetical protein M8J77_007215 [Diaphorina citri]|nr:hypothetical protein M8J77_007215 [Diaphorina citri]
MCLTKSSSISGIGTEESSESSQSSQRLSSEPDDNQIHSCSSISKPLTTCSKPPADNSSKIRFPATRNCTLNNNYVPPKNYVCKWKDCTAKYSIISNLVHHVQLVYLITRSTIHVITQRHLGHFTCLWENCRHYGISYNCAPSWPDHHVLTHTGKTFECFIPGCKKIFKTEVLQRRHITHHLDIISTQSSNNQSKHRDSLVAKSTRKTNKKLRQRRIPYSANKPDFFDRSIMEDVAKRLQIFEKCSQGVIEYSQDMSVIICLKNKVVATRTLLDGVRQKLVRYYPPFVIDEEWVPVESVIGTYKKIAWSLISETGKYYLMKYLDNRKKLIHQQKSSDLAAESKSTLTHKTDTKKILHQCEKNNNSVPSNQNLIVKRITRAKTAGKVK